jgi:hypothetical protein
MLVTYSYCPDCEPRSTTWSTHASSSSWSSPAAHAPTIRSQLRTLRCRRSTALPRPVDPGLLDRVDLYACAAVAGEDERAGSGQTSSGSLTARSWRSVVSGLCTAYEESTAG